MFWKIFLLLAGLQQSDKPIFVDAIFPELVPESDEDRAAELEMVHRCHPRRLPSALRVLSTFRSTALARLSTASFAQLLGKLRAVRHELRGLLHR